MDPKLLVLAIFLGFGALEALTGRFHDPARSGGRDIAIELVSTLTIILITVPAIFYGAAYAAERIAPGSEGALSHWPWWAMAGVLLVADDISPDVLRESSVKKSLPPLYGALLKNEQDVHLFERLAFMARRGQ